MADKPSDLVQGTLDMLILRTLGLEPVHGYGIVVRLEQVSKGVSVSMQFAVCRLSAAATGWTDQKRRESHGQ
jgi:hypothetical protein